jgi:hypothetical protein
MAIHLFLKTSRWRAASKQRLRAISLTAGSQKIKLLYFNFGDLQQAISVWKGATR